MKNRLSAAEVAEITGHLTPGGRELYLRLVAEVKALRILEEAARRLKQARDHRYQYTREVQRLAALARTDQARAKAELTRLDRAPRVWDIGDVTEDICEALEALDTLE